MVRVLKAAAMGRYKIYAALSYIILAKEQEELAYVAEAARDLALIGIDEESIKDFLIRCIKTPLARECLGSGLAVGGYLKALTEFYINSGYEPTNIQPDHPATMLAFVARLIEKEIKEPTKRTTYWRIQHRFIKTHLLNTLTYLKMKIPCRFTDAVLNTIKIDLNLLLTQLTSISDLYPSDAACEQT
jgi:hypothetical protein